MFPPPLEKVQGDFTFAPWKVQGDFTFAPWKVQGDFTFAPWKLQGDFTFAPWKLQGDFTFAPWKLQGAKSKIHLKSSRGGNMFRRVGQKWSKISDENWHKIQYIVK